MSRAKAATGMDMIARLRKSRDIHGKKVALGYGDRVYSYDGLFSEIEALSGLLGGLMRDIRRPIGLYFGNRPEFFTAYYGLVKSRATAMILDHSWKRDELLKVVGDCGIGGFLISRDELDTFPLSDEFHAAGESGGIALLLGGERDFNRPFDGDRLRSAVSCRFSSGTTGTPKCMMYSAENIMAAADNWRTTIGLSSEDKILCLANYSHGLAFNTSMLAPLSVGASIFMTDSLMPGRAARLIEDVGITILVAFPVFFSLMAQERLRDRFDLGSLRLCVSSGTVLHSDVKRKFRENIGIRIADLYGVAETGLCILNDTDDVDSIGTPLRNVEIAIMDASGLKLPTGAVGQIAIKSGSRSRGYYNLPGELEAKITPDGFYLSGDIGYMDASGKVYVRGRLQDFIDVAGKKVDPREVEETLMRLPGIREAAVFPQKSAKNGGEILCAAVAADEAVGRSDITGHMGKSLAPYKIPQRIYFLAELPKNSSGKILKTELAKLQSEKRPG